MFDGISPRYDFLNHLLSFGIDRRWRRMASRRVTQHHPSSILDVATGTADLAIRMAKDSPSSTITGVDLSEKMLERGRAKLIKKGLEHRIDLVTADAVKMPFADDSFDAVTVAFGVRNFNDREAGLREMVRVCRDHGFIAILEFSHPSKKVVAAPYHWYSRTILPWLGRHISKHPTAYNYLPTSVAAFPESDNFVTTLREAGLCQVEVCSLSGGIATLYAGTVSKKQRHNTITHA